MRSVIPRCVFALFVLMTLTTLSACNRSGGGSSKGSPAGANPQVVYLSELESNSRVVTYDPDTGVVTELGRAGILLTDITLFDGALFGSTFTAFYSIDMTTGAASGIGGFGVRNVNALVTHEGDGAIYAAASDGNFLEIDPVTGDAEFIGTYGSGVFSSGDLAFDEDGTLYATVKVSGQSLDFLAEISVDTGLATVIGEIGFIDVFGLGFVDGELLGFTVDGELISIDVNTGLGTLLENSTTVAVSGMGVGSGS